MSNPNPAILTYDDALFRAQVPAFASLKLYPETVLQMFWDFAINYISDVGNFGTLQGPARQYAINFMMAHLIAQGNQTAVGQTPFVLSASTIDKVTVTAVPPPLKNQWQQWMQTTVYGQSLWALLQVTSVGGFYIGGYPTLAAFRPYGNVGFGGGFGYPC